jgi:hypothetical protein
MAISVGWQVFLRKRGQRLLSGPIPGAYIYIKERDTVKQSGKAKP